MSDWCTHIPEGYIVECQGYIAPQNQSTGQSNLIKEWGETHHYFILKHSMEKNVIFI